MVYTETVKRDKEDRAASSKQTALAVRKGAVRNAEQGGLDRSV
jgi:hypothetical protein